MAQSQLNLQFVCRSCRNALSKASSHQTHTRAFTTTPSNSRAIPTFTDTPSADLNAILSEFRDKVFKPAALSKTHQALIYKKSRHSILRNDPGVIVTLSNNEEIKLEPMDRWDRPNKHKSLYQMARILGEERHVSAWENLPQFLEGMVMAKEKVPLKFLEKITRKANEVGRAGLIRRCAEMSKKTGVKLSIPEVTRELFLGIHAKAVEAHFKGKELQNAIEEAQSLVQLMEREDHCAGTLKPLVESDMRTDTMVVAVLLELGAAEALAVHQGKDVGEKVTGLARRFLAVSNQGADILQTRPSTETKTSPTATSSSMANNSVENWIPIANALRLTLKVSGLAGGQKEAEVKLKSTLKKLLEQTDAAIAKEVEVVRRDAKGKPRRALIMLDAVR